MIEGPEPLQRHHFTGDFRCGKDSLDFFLRRYALKNQVGGSARTYVIHEESKVIGYYSLCPSGLSRRLALTEVVAGQGNLDPVPGILLARLAVDGAQQGKGLGKALLKDALLRSINGADMIGGRVIFVHAINDNARVYYEHFGFEQSPIEENVLMLLMRDAKAMIEV